VRSHTPGIGGSLPPPGIRVTIATPVLRLPIATSGGTHGAKSGDTKGCVWRRPVPFVRYLSSSLRHAVVTSSEMVCCGDVPYRGRRGVIVSALPPRQSGTGLTLPCV
jgi:hypothetical protein